MICVKWGGVLLMWAALPWQQCSGAEQSLAWEQAGEGLGLGLGLGEGAAPMAGVWPLGTHTVT